MESLLLNKQPFFQVAAPREAGTGTGGRGSSSKRMAQFTSTPFPRLEYLKHQTLKSQLVFWRQQTGVKPFNRALSNLFSTKPDEYSWGRAMKSWLQGHTNAQFFCTSHQQHKTLEISLSEHWILWMKTDNPAHTKDGRNKFYYGKEAVPMMPAAYKQRPTIPHQVCTRPVV